MPIRTQTRILVPVFLSALAGFMTCGGAIAQQGPTQARTSGTVVDLQRNHTTLTRADIDLPPRGTTMQQVLARYGPPLEKHAPVGEPPITRWDYRDFSMFFEYDLFLHAVVPGDPEPLVHKDELRGG